MEANPTQTTKRFSFSDTTATKKVFALRKRLRAVAGGTSASKTISILIWLIDYCQTRKNNLDYRIADQLIVRTRETVWMDWNPTNEFWFYTEVLPNRAEDTDFITLTYKDNEALDETTVRDIESHKNNPRWWKTYGEGQLG